MEEYIPLIIAVIVALVKILQAGKYKKIARAAVKYGHIVCEAVENNNDTGERLVDSMAIKDKVRAAVLSNAEPALMEVNKLIVNAVDKKKELAPVKRFFRRFIAGENIAGMVLRLVK